ncbi:hypothetical protein HK096_010439, partial [Nowakowskiella sp. JEL0078]
MLGVVNSQIRPHLPSLPSLPFLFTVRTYKRHVVHKPLEKVGVIESQGTLLDHSLG